MYPAGYSSGMSAPSITLQHSIAANLHARRNRYKTLMQTLRDLNTEVTHPDSRWRAKPHWSDQDFIAWAHFSELLTDADDRIIYFH